MIMSSMTKKEVRIHIFCWLIWISIQSLLFPFQGPTALLYVVSPIQYFLPFIVIFYATSLYLLPRFWPKNKIILLLGLCLLFVGFAAFRILMFYYVLPGIDPEFKFNQDYPYVNFVKVNFLWFIQHAFFGVAYFTYKKNLHAIQKNAALERSVIELEYAFLRSQFNPHFLFNTLSYIYSKALPLSEDMADAVIRLAWMMRYSLKKGGSDQKVFLAEELEYVDHFIHLQHLRRNGNTYIDFQQKGSDPNKRIAPLVIASLVENAFKHGKLNDPDFPLQILVEVQREKIEIFVKNKKSLLKGYVSHGIGNQNLKRRLALVYPGMHQLDIINDPQYYACQLIIYEKDTSPDYHENLHHTDPFIHI